MTTLTREDQDALREAAQGFLGARSDADTVRAFLAQPGSAAAGLWAEMAELGWASLLVPEEHGGAEAGMVAAILIAEELGAHLTPGPFISSAVLATSALVLAGTPDQQARWLPPLAMGEATGAVALTGPSGRLAEDLLDVVATQDGDGWRLDGAAGWVLDGETADFVVVAAKVDDAMRLFIVPSDAAGLTITPVEGFDLTRRLANATLEGVTVGADSALAGDGSSVRDAVVQRGIVALAADGAGAGGRALHLAAEYAKERHQFGRPIGSFQAIKHKLANMHIAMHGARLAAQNAAEALDLGAPNADRLVAVAGSFTRTAAVKTAGDAIQAHGGIGFTWEHDCHLLFKRATLDELLLSDAREQYAHLADLVIPASA